MNIFIPMVSMPLPVFVLMAVLSAFGIIFLALHLVGLRMRPK